MNDNQLLSIETNLEQLNKMFNLINEELYENKIIKPKIIISSLNGNQRFRLAENVYTTITKKDSSELAVSRSMLSSGNEKNVFIEMLKYAALCYGYQNNIKITSNRGIYHNKRFKKIAEEHGLKCSYTKYGWDNVELNDIGIKLFNTYDWFFTITGEKTVYNKKLYKHTCGSTRKYICPICGNSVRATKNINIACLDCNEQMVIVKEY